MIQFKINDRVQVEHAFCDFQGETGRVVGFNTNLLGRLLVIVKRDNDDSDKDGDCFYLYELKKVE